MDKREHKATGQLISIQGADVTRIEYRGEPVVTFAMVDSVHQRPDGTAKRNFGENKSRFVEGEDLALIVRAAFLKKDAVRCIFFAVGLN